MDSFAVAVFDLFIGSIFVLSAYVIARNLTRTIRQKEKFLPLHVWTITISYLIMCGSFMFSQTTNPFVFYARFVALVLGVYALGTLVAYQQRRKQ